MLAKHEQPCTGRAHRAFIIRRYSPDGFQKLHLAEVAPYVTLVQRVKTPAVLSDGVAVQVIHPSAFGDLRILARCGRIAQHRKDFLTRALVVAGMSPSERATKQVAVDVDGPDVAVGPRNADNDNLLAIHRLDRCIRVFKETNRHFVLGKRRIPEVIKDLVGLLDADDVEHAGLRLLGAQDDDATRRVGEGGERLPDATRQSPAAVAPLGSLHLQAVAFLELSELA